MFIEIVLSILICIITTYLFGYIVNILLFSKLLKNQTAATIFHVSLFTGFMSLTILTALITTLASSILILSVLPIGFLIYRNFSYPCFTQKEITSHLKGTILPFLFTFSAGLISFSFFIFIFDFFSEDTISLLWGDNGFYINVAEYIRHTGKEDVLSWYTLYENYSTHENISTPYHYGDLHFYNYIYLINIFSIAPIFYYVYVFSSCIGAFVYSLLHLVIDCLFNKTNTYVKYLLPFFLIFCTATTYAFTPVGYFVLMYPKGFFLIALSCIGIVSIYKEKYIESISFFVLIPVFNVLYAPSIYTTIFIFSVLLFYMYKKRSEKKLRDSAYYGFIISIILAVLIIVYYYPYISYSSNLPNYPDFFVSTLSELLWRNIWEFVKVNMWYWMMYLLAFLLYQFSSQNRAYKFILVYLIGFSLLQIVIFQSMLMLKVNQYFQFYEAIAPIAPLLFLLMYYIVLTTYKNKILSTLLLGAIILSATTTYRYKHYSNLEVVVNKNFISQIRNNTTTIKNKLGLYYGNEKEAADNSTYLMFFAGNTLKAIDKDFWAININYKTSIYDIENYYNTKEALLFPMPLNDIKTTPYYKFYEAKKDNIKNETDLQIAFIEEMKIEFIIAHSLEKVPLKVREKAKTSITDPQTKMVFLILNE